MARFRALRNPLLNLNSETVFLESGSPRWWCGGWGWEGVQLPELRNCHFLEHQPHACICLIWRKAALGRLTSWFTHTCLAAGLRSLPCWCAPFACFLPLLPLCYGPVGNRVLVGTQSLRSRGARHFCLLVTEPQGLELSRRLLQVRFWSRWLLWAPCFLCPVNTFCYQVPGPLLSWNSPVYVV